MCDTLKMYKIRHIYRAYRTYLLHQSVRSVEFLAVQQLISLSWSILRTGVTGWRGGCTRVFVM